MAQFAPHSAVRVSDYIDEAPVKGPMLLTPILCFMLMLIEGMDTYGVGYVGPSLSKEYGLSPAVLGAIHTGTVIASLIGATVVAPLADRIGRRWLLIATSLLMGSCTMLTPLAANEVILFLVRFAIGIGFGAAVPTAFSLVADYAPARHRSLIIMMTMSGVAFGMVLAGVAAAFVIPHFGWQALLYLCGSLSVLSTILLLFLLPESLQHLVRRAPEAPATLNAIQKVARARGDRIATRLYVDQASHDVIPVKAVVSGGRAVMTFLLWFAMSCTYALEFFISYWLPTVLLETGADMFAAGMITAAGKTGSVVGALVIGIFMDRLGQARVLVVTYVLTAVAIVFLGASSFNAMIALGMIVTTFFLLDGSFAGIQATTASAFPAEIRATGTGWISGFARLLGGGSGTFAGGLLVEAKLTPSQLSLGMAVPMLLGGFAVWQLRRHLSAQQPALARGQRPLEQTIA